MLTFFSKYVYSAFSKLAEMSRNVPNLLFIKNTCIYLSTKPENRLLVHWNMSWSAVQKISKYGENRDFHRFLPIFTAFGCNFVMGKGFLARIFPTDS